MKSESNSILELGEIIETITPPKKIQTSEFLETGNYPIVDQSPPHVAGWTNDETSLVHPPKEGLIVFGDHTCVLKFQTKPFAQGADGIKIIKVQKEINSHYIYAHLKAYPLLNDGYKRHFSELKRLKILIPDLKIQDYISGIHQLIDAKIDANNALSKTLENIAQAIFESWFIDFEPVKAKISGEKPVGMDDATAALFPDAMVESEIGLIPKGWGVRSIGDSVIKQKVGKLFDSKTSFSSGSIPVLDQGKSGVVGFHDEEPGVIASPDAPLVVFANHTCSLRLISYPFSVIQNVFPLLGNKVDVVWLYFAVEGKQQFDSYKGHWPDFVLHKIIHPTEQATNAFRLTVEPLLKKKWLLDSQSNILANLRDSLIPRLISGELQIPEEMLAS